MTTWPRAVETFETSDGEFHRSRTAAEHHQRRIEAAGRATAMLVSGVSLGAALREYGFLPAGVYPELDEVFASTKLIIEHWQCRDTPGYSPIEVDKYGGIRVYGDAGSWSGPYGSTCSARDVARYWLDTKARTR